MNPSQKTTLRVDRQAITEILADREVTGVMLQVTEAFSGIRNTDALLVRLLGIVGQWIPAERGAVLLAGSKPADLKAVAFQGGSFEVNPEIAAQAAGEHLASLVNVPNSVLCASLRLFEAELGVLYLDSKGANRFTRDSQ